jgi:cytochrome c oxidase subunit 4
MPETREHGHPLVSVSTYLGVFLALMLLTGVTVWAAGRDFGPYNTVVALVIAVTKATLVVLFFMHLKYAPPLVKLTVVAAIVFLGLLLVITMSDYGTRGWLGSGGRGTYQLQDY